MRAAENRLQSSGPMFERSLSMGEGGTSVDAEMFLKLCQAAFDGVLIHDAGRVVAVNEQCARMFGGQPETMVGRNIFDFFNPELRLVVEQNVRDRKEGTVEFTGRRLDGSTIALEACAVTIDGSSLRLVAIRDLTERNQVTESERRYRELSESTHDLICVHEVDGRIVGVNPAAARALGYTREELCAMNIQDVLTPRAIAGYPRYIDTLTRDGSGEGLMSLRTRLGEGRLWHYQNTLQAIGGRMLVSGLARDVTDRERALHDLRKSEHHFRTIIENVSDLVTVLDVAGVIRYVSPSVTRSLGMSVEELTDRSYTELIHPDDAGEAGAVFMRQLTTPHAVGALDARIQHGQGGWRWYSIVVTNRLVDGKVAGVIVNARDITERRLLLAQLEQANRVNGLGRLAATVAHEFNNVLMGMQPFAELIQRPGIAAEMVARGAGYIASSIVRGKRVAMDILRFTQPAQPALGPVVLRDWWDRLVPEMKPGTANDVRLEWTFPEGLAVIADESQLCQVFSNLVNNARQAMPGGGRLDVTARRPAEAETFGFGVVPNPHSYVQISVADTGSGIPPEIIGNVFDPLFTTKRNGGTGLGLAVVHQIVINHGGAIFVESTPGAGTTFHAFFRAADGQETAAAEEVRSVPALARSARILIVDDEVAVAEGLSDVLCAEGHTIAIAGTAAEGEVSAERFRPDVALVDVGLPDGNGVDLAARLRSRYPELRVLIMSGHADASGALLDDSKIRFLQKPFTIEALLTILETFENETSR